MCVNWKAKNLKENINGANEWRFLYATFLSITIDAFECNNKFKRHLWLHVAFKFGIQNDNVVWKCSEIINDSILTFDLSLKFIFMDITSASLFRHLFIRTVSIVIDSVNCNWNRWTKENVKIRRIRSQHMIAMIGHFQFMQNDKRQTIQNIVSPFWIKISAIGWVLKLHGTTTN